MNYKITLTPLERFFFGGENVFGSENGQDERRRSYLVNSNLLPQQTTLLGILREQLLRQNSLLISPDSTREHIQKAIDLVGVSGFTPGHGDDSYGIIKALSPIVLTDESGEIWQPSPLDDREMPDKEKKLKPLTFSIDNSAGKPFLENLNIKESMELQFVTAGGRQKNLSDFFQKYEQVGITMTNRLKHRDLSLEGRKESFYRQTFRGNNTNTLNGNTSNSIYSFTFWMEMSSEISKYQFQDALVYMGGERSAFQMHIESIAEQKDMAQYMAKVSYRHNLLSDELKSRFKQIVLLSDTYADWALIKSNSVFSITQVVPFRYFTTVLHNSTRFYDFKKDNPNTKQQSKLHTLLQRGSVIYVENDKQLKHVTEHLNAQKAFQRIGYNFFQTI